ncbi:MAG: hypothetical protein KJ850_03035 [Gammaproteobacteria bacterium]|nr:hypothetical protein [Gammaproteobacteria bacterium]MBU1624000.1 hypothetical protein [Gammaproteobacteria bacterium]MBU1981728.1 hypothetical protein [Gammaproteobacteria bacterium]
MKRRPQVMLKLLDENLGGMNYEQVRCIFRELAAATPQLRRHLKELRRIFTQHAQQPLLLDLLLSVKDQAFTQLATIGDMLSMGRSYGRDDELVSGLADFLNRMPDDAIRWPANISIVRWVGLLDEASAEQYISLKYRGIPAPVDLNSLLCSADLAALRIDLPKFFLEFLFRQYVGPALHRLEWERRVRIAIATNHLIQDFPMPQAVLEGYVNHEVSSKTFAKMDLAKGVLLLTYHGGFVRLTRALFENQCRDGFTLARLSAEEEGNEEKAGYRDALFKAFRTLQAGKSVLMAPDGPHGSRGCMTTVCSKPIEIGAGAAFLAYETGCSTVWYTMMRDGGGFAPVVVPGPRRETGESYDHFEARLSAFYGDRVTDALCGDPQNIAVGNRLMRLLNEKPGNPPQ